MPASSSSSPGTVAAMGEKEVTEKLEHAEDIPPGQEESSCIGHDKNGGKYTGKVG